MLTRMIVIVSLAAAACGTSTSKSSAPTCSDAVDHAIALMPKAYADDMRAHRDERIAECKRDATAADLACVMKSTTFVELGLCPMPKAGGAQ